MLSDYESEQQHRTMTFVELPNHHLASVASGLTLFFLHTNLNNLNKYTINLINKIIYMTFS